jgi:hypothetical protein
MPAFLIEERGLPGAAIGPGDVDDIRAPDDACRDEPDACLGDELDRHSQRQVDLLEVEDRCARSSIE